MLADSLIHYVNVPIVRIYQSLCANPCTLKLDSLAIRLFLLLISAISASGEESKIDPSQIIGGRDTNSLEFPTVLYVGGCTGSLVAPLWALSAAHCAIGKEPIGGISVERGNPEDHEVRKSVRVVVHPEYVRLQHGHRNDIALIQFDRPFSSKTVQIQDLVDYKLSEVLLQTGTMTTSVGWGRTGKNTYATVLQTTNWPISPCPSTREFDGFTLHDRLFCRKNYPWISQIYWGDSGGPVLVQDQGISWQVGLVTYQANAIINGRWQYYSISHKIAPYKTWVESIVGSEDVQYESDPRGEFDRLIRDLRDVEDILDESIEGLNRLRMRVWKSELETR